jgi:hypothetical protein
LILEAASTGRARGAAATVEGPGNPGRKSRRGAADGGVDLAVDRFGPDIAGDLQPRSHLAASIGASERIRCLCDPNAHPLYAATESTQRQADVPDHHRAHALRHASASAQYFDLHIRTSGLNMSAPASSLATGRGASHTCFEYDP